MLSQTMDDNARCTHKSTGPEELPSDQYDFFLNHFMSIQQATYTTNQIPSFCELSMFCLSVPVAASHFMSVIDGNL